MSEFEEEIIVSLERVSGDASVTVPIPTSNSDNKVNFTAETKTVFCTYPAKRAPSASMTATTYVTTHASTISDTQTMDSGVLAGPVTVSGTVTVTGNLVII